ncbi:MAG: preprotein translocase subunit YajC [Candidatus Aureabacteria bacterium]|nr:preprotein translocase subunit YajC [Candidatus Auribacterota bacterium]
MSPLMSGVGHVAGLLGMAPPPGGAGGQQPGLMQFLPMIVMLVAIFYLLVFRPQQKKQKEQKDMIASIKKGDAVITSGGIHGVVAGLKEDVVVVKVADNVKIEVSKGSISVVTRKGGETPDAADASRSNE